MSAPSQTVDPNLAQQILYDQNAKVAATFWEWRNKLMAFCFTAAGALFAIAGWLYKNVDHHQLAAFPLLVGAVISIGCVKLDWRNHQILWQCYRIGAAIEKEWIPFGDQEPTRRPRWWKSWSAEQPSTCYAKRGPFYMFERHEQTYFRTTRGMFLAVGLLQLCGAVFAFAT